MRKLITCFIVFLLVILTGCNQKSEITSLYPCADGQNTILLYDRFNYQIFSYNVEKMDVEEKRKADNLIQYEFSTPCEYFSSGNCIIDKFSIIKLENNKVIELLKVQTGKRLFPVAASGNNIFFGLCTHTEDDFNKVLVKYDKDNNCLIEYPNVNGRICKGTIIGDKLFYTTYEKVDRQTSTYSLYSVNFYDKNAEPHLEMQDLELDDIYSQGGRLYLTNEKYIYSQDGKKFLKGCQNYFIGDNLLVQYFINSSAEMILKITDTNTNEILFTVPKILGFEVKENQIVAYCYKKIETFNF